MPFNLLACPTTSIDFALFSFIGFFLLALLVIVARYVRIPIMGVFVGIGMLVFSMGLFACNSMLGIILLCVSVFVMGASIKAGLGS